MSDDADLPKALVKRLIKEKLAACDGSAAGDDKRALQLNKDALLALSEGAKIFILYLTAAANAHCKAANRQTLSEEDVYAALNEIQFSEFAAPLRASAHAYKQRAKKTKGSGKGA